jgi:pyruvate/2-oxoglutarate dehydrogenase complex dihydrolipoamide dehydrogenase (E3) component
MVETRQVDVVVMGLGVGGEEVAGRLAVAGLNVVGVENTLVGGECPYWGCIPTKIMVRAGSALAEARRIPLVAGTSTVTPDWAPVAKKIREQATDDWNDKVAVDRFTGKGGHFVRGTAEVTGPGRVEVGDQVFEATRGIVVATGTYAVIPPVEGLAETPYWTNRDAVEADHLPESMIVLGGGAIGSELAQVFARFGVHVTIIEGSDRLLAMEEPESSQVARQVFEADGIEVHTGVHAAKVSYDDGFTVTLADSRTITGEKLLVCAGRAARLRGLGLEHLGAVHRDRRVDASRRKRVGRRRHHRERRIHPYGHVRGGYRRP